MNAMCMCKISQRSECDCGIYFGLCTETLAMYICNIFYFTVSRCKGVIHNVRELTM